MYIKMYTYPIETISLTQARKEFLPLIKRVEDNLSKFVVTKQGKPVAVILSYEEYVRMVETLKLIREVKQGLTEVEQGKVMPLKSIDNE
jgi:prevent-host-death family protein